MNTLADFITALESTSAAYAVGWIDATAKGEMLGRGIFEEGQLDRGKIRPVAARKSKSIPFNAPRFLMSGLVVRWFNKVYFGSVPLSGRNRLRTLDDFFFPLDRVHNWNRLYGKRGFHQFQCVIPTDAAPAALQQMLDQIAASGLASPLAVLKKLGPGRAGLLSFPMEGYTLAVDFPDRAKARELISLLEKITLQASGRIYLAKDSLASPAAVRLMYAELGDWQRIVVKLDPDGVFETGLSRRLKLRTAL